jgi:hypothetical protein
MRSFAYILLGYLLALLLVGTSPVGAGSGVHQGQLLDALVPHVHFVDGQPAQKSAPVATSDPTLYRSGPTFGAGAGAAAANLTGAAIAPGLPLRAAALRADSERWVVILSDERLPLGRTDAPPDPPPTA